MAPRRIWYFSNLKDTSLKYDVLPGLGLYGMPPEAGTGLGVVKQRGPAEEGPWLYSGFLIYLFVFQS